MIKSKFKRGDNSIKWTIIRTYAQTGLTFRELSEKFGVPVSRIYEILNDYLKQNITDVPPGKQIYYLSFAEKGRRQITMWNDISFAASSFKEALSMFEVAFGNKYDLKKIEL